MLFLDMVHNHNPVLSLPHFSESYSSSSWLNQPLVVIRPANGPNKRWLTTHGILGSGEIGDGPVRRQMTNYEETGMDQIADGVDQVRGELTK